MKQKVMEKGTRRSDVTRQRILLAAREAFATLGYERATVRKIAEMAEIHPSMVMRYFSSKEGLFTASSPFEIGLRDLSRFPPEEMGRALVEIFLDRWEKDGVAGDLPALLRLSVTHPDGRSKVIEVFTTQIAPGIMKISRAKDPAKSAALVATQVVGIAFLRYVVRLPAVVRMRREELVDEVGATLQRYLDGQ
ncbi:MAG TPA: TetR family transcriptional regulator [Edaphobacter sp.]|nr:TetR family transcriptional regulator [Edaphobacter sp.]